MKPYKCKKHGEDVDVYIGTKIRYGESFINRECSICRGERRRKYKEKSTDNIGTSSKLHITSGKSIEVTDKDRNLAYKRAWNAHQKALKYGSKISDLTAHEIFEILSNNTICSYCGNKCDSLTIDHMVPLSLGGDNTKSNITVSCLSCNSSKGVKKWPNKKQPRDCEEGFAFV